MDSEAPAQYLYDSLDLRPFKGASRLFHIDSIPGHLAKLYRTPLDPRGREALEHLIRIPENASAAERRMLAESTSWPVAVLVRAGIAVGCVIPEAPEKFRHDFGPGEGSRVLEIDWLCVPELRLRRTGLPIPTDGDRLEVVRDLVAVAEFFERRDLVYSDWSYSNALWGTSDHSAYVVDIDQTATQRFDDPHHPNWSDPLSSDSEGAADKFTDRYRLALLVARCLTGRRGISDVLEGLLAFRGFGAATLADVLMRMLTADVRHARPSAHELGRALSHRRADDQAPTDTGAAAKGPGSALILPVYVVVQTSQSMSPVEHELNKALRGLVAAVAGRPVTEELVRLSVITFADQPTVTLEMSNRTAHYAMPPVRIGGRANLASMLDMLRDQIGRDVGSLKESGRVLRPMVFLLANGRTVEPSAAWTEAADRLTDRRWPLHPHVIAYGIGDANEQVLRRLSTVTTFMSDTARPGGAPSRINAALEALSASLVTSAVETILVPVDISGFRVLSPEPHRPSTGDADRTESGPLTLTLSEVAPQDFESLRAWLFARPDVVVEVVSRPPTPGRPHGSDELAVIGKRGALAGVLRNLVDFVRSRRSTTLRVATAKGSLQIKMNGTDAADTEVSIRHLLDD